MAYTIYDFTQEIRAIAAEIFKDELEETTEVHINRTSERYRNLQNIFGDNIELIDKLYQQSKN